jgi:VWFA-related protein
MFRSVFPLTLAMAIIAGMARTPSATPAQQTPPSGQRPVFTATVNFVQMDVIVRDDKNRFVPGLTLNDFVIYEDNVRQTIGVFKPYIGGRNMNPGAGATVRSPSSAGLILPQRAAADTTGRVFIIFIDDLNFQFKSTGQVKRVMDLIKTIVQPEDLVGIVSSGYSSIEVDLMHDYGYQHIDAAIKKTAGSGMDSKEIVSAASTSQGPAGLRYMAHTAMKTANDILDKLALLNGVRKSFLFISEGYDFDPYKDSRLAAEQERYGSMSDPSGSGEGTNSTQISDPFQKNGQQFSDSDLVADLAELIRHANRANTTFYPIDPRGLSTGPDIDERVSQTESRDHLMTSVNSLKSIASNTGGFCVCETNDFKGGLDRINNETSDYYMLGYNSTNADPKQRRRQIRIEMAKPGLELTYRTEYTLPRK